jgi:hypothetical protein
MAGDWARCIDSARGLDPGALVQLHSWLACPPCESLPGQSQDGNRIGS